MAERVTSIALELEMARGRVVADLLGEVTVCRGFQEVPDAVAERYIAEVQQDRLDTRAAEAAQAAEAALAGNPIRARVQALRAKAVVVDNDTPALAVMLADDEDNALERSGRAKDDMMRRDPNQMRYHRVRQED